MAAKDAHADRRKRWRRHNNEHAAISAAWRRSGYAYPPPAFPPIPDDLIGLSCGARTRNGGRCLLTSIYLNGRCKFHGGLSTGPTTKAGKIAAKENLKRRWPSEPHEGLIKAMFETEPGPFREQYAHARPREDGDQ